MLRGAKIITLCGSWEISETIRSMKRVIQLREGCVVLIPEFPRRRPKTTQQKADLMAAHFAKISASDSVYIVVKERIGVNTAIELGYAEALGRKIVIAFTGTREETIALRASIDEFAMYDQLEVPANEYFKGKNYAVGDGGT